MDLNFLHGFNGAYKGYYLLDVIPYRICIYIATAF